MLRQLKPCRCGEMLGWTEKRITYRDQFYDEKGEAWASESKGEYGGRRKYCPDCRRDITSLIGDQPIKDVTND